MATILQIFLVVGVPELLATVKCMGGGVYIYIFGNVDFGESLPWLLRGSKYLKLSKNPIFKYGLYLIYI